MFKKLCGFKYIQSLGFKAFIQYVLFGRKIGRLDSDKLFRINPKTAMFPINLRHGSSDIDVFYQIYCVEEYRMIKKLNVKSLLDLGANIGLSTSYLLSSFPEAKAVCVEPDVENLELCRKNLSAYGNRVDIQGAAVGATRGWCQVDSKTLGKRKEFARTFDRASGLSEGVPIITVRDCLVIAGVEKFDLVKIDIEGGETELFSAPSDWLDCVQNLVIEIHGKKAKEVVMGAMSVYSYAHFISHELDVFLDIKRK
jgi:FkbM family methyltransferase